MNNQGRLAFELGRIGVDAEHVSKILDAVDQIYGAADVAKSETVEIFWDGDRLDPYVYALVDALAVFFFDYEAGWWEPRPVSPDTLRELARGPHWQQGAENVPRENRDGQRFIPFSRSAIQQ